MEKLKREGLVRNIGVSNFTMTQLADLMESATIMPAVNQIEFHPYLQDRRLLHYCMENTICVTAYSPLGTPGSYGAKQPEAPPPLLSHPVVVAIAERYNKTPAQVLLNWNISLGTVVVPKSTNPQRIEENFNFLDFALDDDAMEQISELNLDFRYSKGWMPGHFLPERLPID
eukprot:Colp12_sorted_trinity150504_noHs@18390